MAIKHDAQGFLIGELVDLNQEILRQQQSAATNIASIRQNVSAMARAMGVEVRRSAPTSAVSSTVRAKPAATAVPAARTGAAVARAVTSAPRGARGKAEVPTATPRARGANGRFIKGAGGDKANKPDADTDSPARGGSRLARVFSAGRDATGTLSENVDPGLQAAKEIRTVVAPLGRSLWAALGTNGERKKERTKERWYRRILKALTGRSSGEPAAGGGGGGGLLDGLGGIGGLLGRVLPALGSVLLPILGVVGAGLAGLGIGKLIYGWLDSAGITTKLFDAVDWMKTKWSSAVDGLAGKWDDLTKWLADKTKPIKDGANKIRDAAKKAKDDFTDGFNGGVGAGGAGAPAPVAKTAGAVAAAVVNAVRPVAEAISQPVTTIARVAGRAGGLAREAISAGITDPRKLALLLGQMGHESAGFTRMQENLGYSGSRLLEVFPKHFKSAADANAIASQGPEAIANRVYGGRMGNNKAGDGFRYRGRGYVHLTGRANYAAAGKALGLDLVGNPDLAAEPTVAAQIAVWYWQARVAGKGADTSVLASTRAIQGGQRGLADRAARVRSFENMLGGGSTTMTSAPLRASSMRMPNLGAAQIPAMPDVAIPEALSRPKLPPVTAIVKQPLGQDVGDRKIAHVVTGGMGS